MKKYKFRKYPKNIVSLFEKEKEKLKKILPPKSKIEHVGSTAVPGLKGKGILDILLIVNKEYFKGVAEILPKNKYLRMINAGNKDRISFQRDYWKLFGKRRVHLHLTYNRSKTEKEQIKFRNNLRKSKKLQIEYEEIKKHAVKVCNGRGKVYRELKKDFMKKYSK